MAGSRRPGAPDANGIYQAVARAGERAGVAVYPHRFRHHFSHTWLDRGGAEGDLMELNGWVSPQMLTRYIRGQRPGCPRPPRLRPCHDRRPLTPAATPLTPAARRRHAQETVSADSAVTLPIQSPGHQLTLWGCSPAVLAEPVLLALGEHMLHGRNDGGFFVREVFGQCRGHSG
jgi:hypothetical protein